MNLQENIHRIKKMMGLYEQSEEIKAKASIKGLINFFDLKNEKVYRYKVVAKVDDDLSFNVFVRKFDDTNGEIVFINPQDESEETMTIPIEKINEIKQKAPLKENIYKILSFKKLTKEINVNLMFYEESTLSVVK